MRKAWHDTLQITFRQNLVQYKVRVISGFPYSDNCVLTCSCVEGSSACLKEAYIAAMLLSKDPITFQLTANGAWTDAGKDRRCGYSLEFVLVLRRPFENSYRAFKDVHNLSFQVNPRYYRLILCHPALANIT